MSALMKKPWLKRELLSQLEVHFGEKAAWLESNDSNEHEHAPALQDLICSGGRVQVVQAQFLKSSDCNVRAILSDAQFHIKAILSDSAVADMKRYCPA
ncbi:hypothetical protein HDU79_000409 [Rhizoclosmatium sp. JEL0117]|nr:hypothetical protein HDU79_000409 [Rhizoclosmatium sp. JEL0117]